MYICVGKCIYTCMLYMYIFELVKIKTSCLHGYQVSLAYSRYCSFRYDINKSSPQLM